MSGLIDPASGAFEVTPSDTENLEINTTAVFVGTGGDLKVDMANGDTVTFVVAASTLLPIQVRKIYSTGTDADDIVGIY